MRILYGVFGYGRGHATRALGVLPQLRERHEVLVLAAGDAFETLSEEYRVLRLPSIGYVYGESGRHSLKRTVVDNAKPLVDALLGTGEARSLAREVERFAPTAAIVDAEPFTHRLAERMGIPRIAFDHFGLLVHCRLDVPWFDRPRLARDAFAYRALMGCPDGVVVSSFYPVQPKDESVRCVGPLLREAARRLQPSDEGHLLVYLNRGRHQWSERLEHECARLGHPVVVYGLGEGKRGTVWFRKPDHRTFLEDLAGARAVLSTAGNQLVGECIHFGKPLLVLPENTLEQRLNARAVEKLGIGQRADIQSLGVPRLRRFLGDLERHRAAIARVRERPLPDAQTVLEDSLSSLARRRPGPVLSDWKYA